MSGNDDLTDFYKGKPVPAALVRMGMNKELKAYAIILSEQLGLPADMLITEKMMLDVISANLIGGIVKDEMKSEVGRLRFDAIVAKFQERARALGIMFGITPTQAEGVILERAAGGKIELGKMVLALFGHRHIPLPYAVLRAGFEGEIKAYAILLNDQFGLPADMVITEEMMLKAIQAHLLGGEAEAEMKQEIGLVRFDGIVAKFQERARAHEIMFGIAPGQVKEVVLKM